VPAAVAAEEGQPRVELVVGLVPALRLRHRHPALDLAALRGDPREPVVEHPRDPVLDLEVGTAALTAKPVVLCQPAAADRAAHDVERLDHPVSISTRTPNTARLRGSGGLPSPQQSPCPSAPSSSGRSSAHISPTG